MAAPDIEFWTTEAMKNDYPYTVYDTAIEYCIVLFVFFHSFERHPIQSEFCTTKAVALYSGDEIYSNQESLEPNELQLPETT